MATSGSYDYSLSRDSLILLAYQSINIYDKEATTADMSSADVTIANNILNGLIKTWQTEGIKLWKRRIGYLFPAIGQRKYELGTASGADHCTNTYVATTLSAAEAAAQTVLSLTSTTGMTAADFIGIELDDGTRQWTTIVSVDSATQVTITTALTGAAASGNTVITYTTKLNRPLNVIRGTTLDLKSSSQTEQMMDPISHDTYFNMPTKSLAGVPNNFYYDKLITGATPHTASLYLYPQPNSVSKIITFSYQDSIQDFDSSANNPDFPQEWYYPLAINLGVELGYFLGKFNEIPIIEAHAKELKASCINFDSDNTALKVSIKKSKK